MSYDHQALALPESIGSSHGILVKFEDLTSTHGNRYDLDDKSSIQGENEIDIMQTVLKTKKYELLGLTANQYFESQESFKFREGSLFKIGFPVEMYDTRITDSMGNVYNNGPKEATIPLIVEPKKVKNKVTGQWEVKTDAAPILKYELNGKRWNVSATFGLVEVGNYTQTVMDGNYLTSVCREEKYNPSTRKMEPCVRVLRPDGLARESEDPSLSYIRYGTTDPTATSFTLHLNFPFVDEEGTRISEEAEKQNESICRISIFYLFHAYKLGFYTQDVSLKSLIDFEFNRACSDFITDQKKMYVKSLGIKDLDEYNDAMDMFETKFVEKFREIQDTLRSEEPKMRDVISTRLLYQNVRGIIDTDFRKVRNVKCKDANGNEIERSFPTYYVKGKKYNGLPTTTNIAKEIEKENRFLSTLELKMQTEKGAPFEHVNPETKESSLVYKHRFLNPIYMYRIRDMSRVPFPSYIIDIPNQEPVVVPMNDFRQYYATKIQDERGETKVVRVISRVIPRFLFETISFSLKGKSVGVDLEHEACIEVGRRPERQSGPRIDEVVDTTPSFLRQIMDSESNESNIEDIHENEDVDSFHSGMDSPYTENKRLLSMMDTCDETESSMNFECIMDDVIDDFEPPVKQSKKRGKKNE